MIKINPKYLIFLLIVVGLYVLLLVFLPRKFNWNVTFYEKDKNPFGSYVFKSVADRSWTGQVNTSGKTLFELRDLEEENLLVISNIFEISDSDMDALLYLLESGKTVIIAANRIDTLLTNKFQAEMNEWNFSFIFDNLWGVDSVGLRLSESYGHRPKTYWLPGQLNNQYFVQIDSLTTEIMARNHTDQPVLLKMPYHAGKLVLCSVPMVFSNFSMLTKDNNEFTAGILSLVQEGNLHWTSYYQMGRMEAKTPLRYILTEPALTWAFYIAMGSMLLFMAFESKRRQRIIPVIQAPKNETLLFVKTIARLYYQKKDHKQVAGRKILYFMDYLKQKLLIDINENIDEVIRKLAAKTGSSEEEVRQLLEQISYIGSARSITASELHTLVTRIENIQKEN